MYIALPLLTLSTSELTVHSEVGEVRKSPLHKAKYMWSKHYRQDIRGSGRKKEGPRDRQIGDQRGEGRERVRLKERGVVCFVRTISN